MRLGIKEIEQILPHRHPFLLVDYIEEMEPGVSAVGYKCVTFHEDFFRDFGNTIILWVGNFILQIFLSLLSNASL